MGRRKDPPDADVVVRRVSGENRSWDPCPSFGQAAEISGSHAFGGNRNVG